MINEYQKIDLFEKTLLQKISLKPPFTFDFPGAPARFRSSVEPHGAIPFSAKNPDLGNIQNATYLVSGLLST